MLSGLNISQLSSLGSSFLCAVPYVGGFPQQAAEKAISDSKPLFY